MTSTTSAAVIEWVTAEQVEFYDSVRRFARNLGAGVSGRDREASFDRDGWRRCGDFGIQGLPAPEQYGGGGADAVTTILALDALGYGCEDSGLVFSINAHMWTSVVPIWRYGSPDQRQRWLPGLASGELIGCHAITESDAGSDAFALTTTATRTNDGYILNGHKIFITNASVADVMIIFARTSDGVGPFGISAFIVEAGAKGCSAAREIEKLGLRTSPMAEIVLDDCFVGDDALLGKSGQGGEIFNESMRWERACIMSSQVGVMRRTMERCIDYAKSRSQFGKPIGKYESVADKIANMKIAVEASRSLLLRVGWLMDHDRDTTVEAAVAKTFISEAAIRTHLDALQIHGGHGYTTELDVERHLRDALGATIYSGTSEIQRRIIARGLGL